LQRTLPVLVVSVVLFVTITVLLCLPCCARVGACTCIGDEGEKRYGNWKQAIWFIFALIILVAGCVAGIFANVQSNVIISDTGNAFNSKLNDIKQIGDNITEVLQNTTYQVPGGIVSEIENALSNMSADIQETTSHVKQVGPYKDIYAYASTVWIILLGIVACAYIAIGNKFLFHLIGFMAWCVLIGVCIFMIVMFLISVIFSDICREVNYNPGILELIRNSAEDAYTTVADLYQNDADQLVNSVCNELSQICPKQPDLCYCNASVFTDLPNRIVVEPSGKTTVATCATSCVNSNLKNLSNTVTDAVELYVLLKSVLADVNQLVLGIADPDTKATLNDAVCHTSTVTQPLWAACGLVLFALSFLAITLLAVDRAVCCFKDPYWNSDEYHEML